MNSFSQSVCAVLLAVLFMETIPPNKGDAIVFPPATVADSLKLTRDTSITLPAKLFTSG